MTEQPHDTPAFQHAAEYTIAVTFVVAGGKRPRTADQRAHRVFEQIANYTARLGHVVEVTAAGGASTDGTVTWPTPVRFAAANSGPTAVGSDKLARYVDCERDRALSSLAEANAVQRARRETDRQRRTAVSCHNTNQPFLDGDRRCRCVYCDPEAHLLAIRAAQRGDPDRFVEHRCLCGRPVTQAGQRCTAHRDTELTVLSGDPAALQLLPDLMPSG